MSLIPAWAPNLHPLIVHFPIALLFAAGAVDLAGLLMRGRRPVRDAATWLYIAGAVTAVAAYFTGDAAAKAMALSPDVTALVEAHAGWAFRATWLFAFFASLRLAMSYILRPRRSLRLGALVIALAGLGALAQTALHGRRLVFEQGMASRPWRPRRERPEQRTERAVRAVRRCAGGAGRARTERGERRTERKERIRNEVAADCVTRGDGRRQRRVGTGTDVGRAVADLRHGERRMAELRRRHRRHQVLAARPDRRRQLQQPGDRVGVDVDRQLRQPDHARRRRMVGARSTSSSNRWSRRLPTSTAAASRPTRRACRRRR